jgi:hypothetical protein
MELVGTASERSNRLVLIAPTNPNAVPLVGRRVVPDDDEPGAVATPVPEITVAPTS